MLSLTTANDSIKFFDKDLKVIVQDEVNEEKYEIKYHWMGKISVEFILATFIKNEIGIKRFDFSNVKNSKESSKIVLQ